MSESQLALDNFKKGTKRDVTAFPTFKNEKYYDSLHCAFCGTTKAQEVGNITGPDSCSKCSDIHAQLLFVEQQSFMYSAQVISVQTQQGNKLVKEYEDDTQYSDVNFMS